MCGAKEGLKLDAAAMVRSPAALLRRFGASGAGGRVAEQRDEDKSGPEGVVTICALQVAEIRDQQDSNIQQLVDMTWYTWEGLFDDEIVELATTELQGSSTGFLWHKYLSDSDGEMGKKCTAFVAACTGGPIDAGDKNGGASPLMGTSELPEEDKEELHKADAASPKVRAVLRFARFRRCLWRGIHGCPAPVRVGSARRRAQVREEEGWRPRVRGICRPLPP